jgi:lysophospholipase L1-like esterase
MVKNLLTTLATLVVLVALFELTLFLVGLRYKARIDLRDPDLDPATRRVVCIGESTTYGARVERSEAFPVVLERHLRAIDGIDVKIYNLGVPGVTSTTILRNFEANLIEFAPRLVIVNMGANDFSVSLSQQSSIRDSELPLSWAKLLYRSRTFRLYKLLTDVHNRRNVVGEGETGQPTLVASYEVAQEAGKRENAAFLASAAAQLDFNTRQIVSLARRRDVRVLLVGYLRSRANDSMRATAESLGVPWADVTPEGPLGPFLSGDRFHPNPAGHRHIARRIAAAIEANGLLD